MFPNIFSSMMTVSGNTGYFHTAGNEAMKPIPLFFNGFHRTGICQFTSTLFRMGGGGECEKVPC